MRRWGFVACVTLFVLAFASAASAQPPQPSLAVSATPGLFPGFDRTVSDYVVRCNDQSVVVHVTASRGTTVKVAGTSARSGEFDVAVPLGSGEAFPIIVNAPHGQSRHSVRCLPDDFPSFTVNRAGIPQAQWYVVAPGLNFAGPAGNYVSVFDNRGVPVWWYRTAASPMDARLLPDGNIAWGHFLSASGYEERSWGGSLVRVYSTVGSDPDSHELLSLPNGDVMMMSYAPRPGTVDLSSIGGPSSGATVSDGVFEEIDPTGNVVWRWSTADHIPAYDMGLRWLPSIVPATLSDGRQLYDVYHPNSIAVDGSAVIVSLRHADAVYKIDKASGEILWKLGGRQTSDSLRVVGDPNASPQDAVFGGQHDAGVLDDGTVTVYDNGTFRNRAPRAVRYRIDDAERTATLVESIQDSDVPSSLCCGSARKLAGGDWVIGWGGGNTQFGEYTSNGESVFSLRFDGGLFTYRAQPVPFGELSAQTLRQGMNTMNPH